jgi:copper chaperone NosL
MIQPFVRLLFFTSIIFFTLPIQVAKTTSSTTVAPEVETTSPGRFDVCPVCGMFVAKYQEWVATVSFKDGSTHHFDGAKDLFKYLLNLKKYIPNLSREDIVVVAVSEYYDLKRISAQAAWYVIGSDVLGPMGHELVPLASHEDAEIFLKDHNGKKILRFNEITLPLLKELDQIEFNLDD